MENESNTTLIEHVTEIRKRVIYSVSCLAIVFIGLWFIRNDLLNIYILPLADLMKEVTGEIILLKLIDKFMIHLKTCLFFTIVLSLPFCLYQIWKFISPGLYPKEKLSVQVISILTLALFYLGIVTAYFVVIPIGFKFLVNYSVENQGVFHTLAVNNKLSISLSDQITFTQKFLLVFGFVFQTPLVMLMIVKTGVVSVDTLTKYRKHAIVLCMIVAAILTPPDPVTMIGLGLPLVVLYEFGLILCRIFKPKKENL